MERLGFELIGPAGDQVAYEYRSPGRTSTGVIPFRLVVGGRGIDSSGVDAPR
jgi:hypothetical protein